MARNFLHNSLVTMMALVVTSIGCDRVSIKGTKGSNRGAQTANPASNPNDKTSGENGGTGGGGAAGGTAGAGQIEPRTDLNIEPPFLLYMMNDWQRCRPSDLTIQESQKAPAYHHSRCIPAQYSSYRCTKKNIPEFCFYFVNGDGDLFLDAADKNSANQLFSQCDCSTGYTLDPAADNINEPYPLGPFGSHKSHTGKMFWSDMNPAKNQFDFRGIDEAVAQVQQNKLLQNGKEVSGAATITIPIYGAYCRDLTPKWVYREMCGGAEYGLRFFKYHRDGDVAKSYRIQCSCNPSTTGYANEFFGGDSDSAVTDVKSLCTNFIANTPPNGIAVEDSCDMPPFAPSGPWWDNLAKTIQKAGEYSVGKPEVGIILTSSGTDDEGICSTHNGWISDCPDPGKFVEYNNKLTDVYAAAFSDKYILAQLTGGSYLSRPLQYILDHYSFASHPAPKASLKRARVGLKGNYFVPDGDNQSYYHGNKNHEATFMPNNETTDIYREGFMDYFQSSWRKIITGAEHGFPSARKRWAGDYADQTLYQFYLQGLNAHVIMLDTLEMQMHDKWDNEFLQKYLGKSATDTPDAWTIMHETKYLCRPDGSALGSAQAEQEFGQCQNNHDYSINCCEEVAKKYSYVQWRVGRSGVRGDFSFFLERVGSIEGGKTVAIPPLEVLDWDFDRDEFIKSTRRETPDVAPGESSEYRKYIPDSLKTHRYSYSARRTDVGNNQNYMYFKLDGDFPRKSAKLSGYKVGVIFLNTGSDDFAIEYVNASGATKSVNITKTNTPEWREEIVDLPDAVFNQTMDPGNLSDFRLNAKTGDEVIHMVKVINQ